MSRIKLCGLMKVEDIQTANELCPDYIGFVFAEKSRRYISPEQAASFKSILSLIIKAVGVFVNESAENVAKLLNENVIDIAQLHGNESEDYIKKLRALTDKPIIKAFGIANENDVILAEKSSADYILLDSVGGGTGKAFDWGLIKNVTRPYFLAGGFDSENVSDAINLLNPFAVDVSSGIETDGIKDKNKMKNFVDTVRSIDKKE